MYTYVNVFLRLATSRFLSNYLPMDYYSEVVLPSYGMQELLGEGLSTKESPFEYIQGLQPIAFVHIDYWIRLYEGVFKD